MLNALYTIIIEPLVQIIEIFFMIFYRMSNSGMAIIGISIVVSLLTYPFYAAGEIWQQREREIQKSMRGKLKKIKEVFSGDERYMILAAYYRQNHYHPVYALRKSLGIFIQIPFFIAAYRYLSHLKIIDGVSFLFIRNLGRSDALIPILNGINLLPVIMTLVNIVSTFIYTKSFSFKEALPLYGISGIFLVLLYNAPAGLVLYWICNNIFSLIKNFLLKMPLPKKTIKIIIYGIICLASLYTAFYLVFIFDKGYFIKRAALAFCFLLIVSIPLLRAGFGSLIRKYVHEKAINASNSKEFIVSAFFLALFAGITIPSTLIASSVEEFSFIPPFTSPFNFITATMLQSCGFFLFWPASIYLMFSRKIKFYVMFFMTAASIIALINTYIFTGDYGFLTINLMLSNPVFTQDILFIIFEIFASLAICALILYLSMNKKALLFSIQTIILIATVIFSITNLVKINNKFLQYAQSNSEMQKKPDPVFSFSNKGKNVIVIMLDRACSAFMPAVLEEKPELNEKFSGFVWYPNCVSFGPVTLTGAPPLYGGYEYTPREFAKNTNVLLREKHNQALLVMPRIFSEDGFRVTVTDPSWANYNYKSDISIFNNYPSIHAYKIIGKYTKYWMNKHPEIKTINSSAFLKYNLLRFSLLRMASPFLRFFIYDDGKWLAKINEAAGIDIIMLDEYIALDILPEISTIDDSNINTFSMITNQLTHEPEFLQPPQYTPPRVNTTASNAIDISISKYSDRKEYHVTMAAMLLLSKFFSYLSEHNVYDNTRIIVVSDHGWNYSIKSDENIILPNGEHIIRYNPLLLVKDFNMNSELTVNTVFMTNADTPYLATENLIPGAKNPWSGNPLQKENEKESVTITSLDLWSPDQQSKFTLKIAESQYLTVHTNIFNAENWNRGSP
ncbi:MAG: YidC/Oxa1 family membrane protein insertase [Spirochaetaceae bacterium]|nr:YidC/Oxa1 family membrane protein insertase [Spirochaetaceae bacterium]